MIQVYDLLQCTYRDSIQQDVGCPGLPGEAVQLLQLLLVLLRQQLNILLCQNGSYLLGIPAAFCLLISISITVLITESPRSQASCCLKQALCQGDSALP